MSQRVLLLLLFLAALVPNNLSAQRKKSPVLKIGDIIQYHSHANNEPRLGLVIKLGPLLEVETNSKSGLLDIERIHTAASEFTIVDRLGQPAKQEARTWQSSDGKFKIKAKMLRVEGDKVRLEKANGKTLAVSIDQLSEADRSYINNGGKSASKTSENPFDVEETDDVPDELRRLIERRQQLMQLQTKHERLAKLHPNMLIGDIIVHKDFFKGQKYAIVTSLGMRTTVESVDENGELDEGTFRPREQWWYVDRELVAVPMAQRTWNSAGGAFSIEATLIDIKGEDLLVLKKRDGKTSKVPLAKLSSVDKNYVARTRSKLNVRNDEQLIRERESYGSELNTLLARRSQLIQRESANLVASKEASKMRTIGLNVKPIQLTAKELKPEGLGDELFTMKFAIRAPDNAGVDGIRYAKQSGYVALAAGSPFRGRPTLAVVNVNNRQVVTNVDSDELGEDGEVIALSPSGETLVVASEAGLRNKQLELWKFKTGQLVRKSVVSYESSSTPTAHLFSDDNGIVKNSNGVIEFYDVSDRFIPTHQVRAGKRSRFQVSEDQKHLMLYSAESSSFHVIDVNQKKCVGGMNFPESSSRFGYGQFAEVNGDGKTITFLNQSRLSIFDIATRKIVSQHELPSRSSRFLGSRTGFLNLRNDVVAVSNTIFDLDLGVEIGSIGRGSSFGGSKTYADGSRVMGDLDDSRSASSNQGGASLGATDFTQIGKRKDKYVTQSASVMVQRLPIDNVLAHADSLNESDILVFGRGDTLQLEFDLGREKYVEKNLRAKIKAIMDQGGVEIVDKSDFVMTFTYDTGKKQTRKYQIVGGMKPYERTVSVTPKTCSAILTYRDERIWGRGDSVSLGHPFSEEQLDNTISESKSFSARLLLDFEYPDKWRGLLPSKRKEFQWQ